MKSFIFKGKLSELILKLKWCIENEKEINRFL